MRYKYLYLPLLVGLWTLPVYADGVGDELAFDEYLPAPQDAVPTVTAAGDFLLPTYMLPVDSDLLVSVHALNQTEPSVRLTMQENETLPALQQLPEEKRTVSEQQTQTPAEDFTFLRKQQQLLGRSQDELNALSKTAEQETKDVAQQPVLQTMPQPQEQTKSDRQQAAVTSAVKTAPTETKRLLIPMGTAVEPESDETTENLWEETPEAPRRYVVPSRYADQILYTAGQRQSNSLFVMPKEIKVSFYPDSFALSGQAVKWIKAFALGAIQDPKVMIDVRISTTKPWLQDKRLKIVQQVLLQNGLSAHQLKITFVSRAENSLLLRYIDRVDEGEVIVSHRGKYEKK